MSNVKSTLFVSLALLSSLASAGTYTYYDLGASFTPTNISPTTGYIVGKNPQSGGITRDAYMTFTYSGSGTTISSLQVVPLLSGDPYQQSALPVSVNDSGDVVGTAVTTPHGYEWNLIAGGSPIQLAGTTTPYATYALCMNNYGEIAGQVIGNADALWGAIWATPSSAITPVQDPFSWEGEFQLSFFAINNYGDLLCTAAHGTANGYWYNGSTFTGIASCDAVTALNDSNQIVGTYPHPTNASPANTYNPTACIWSSPTASPTPLDDATTVTSSANALNNSGTVVGTFTTQYPNPVMPHAFVWTSGSGMVDLNGSGVVYPALPSGVTLETALAIDSYGDIVGTGQVVVSGVPSTHAFLLIPSTGGA